MAAELKLVRSPAEEALIARFPAEKASLPGGAGIGKLREAAFERVSRAGLPNRRVEAYKYTDLKALMREAAPAAAPAPAVLLKALADGCIVLGGMEAIRIVIANGRVEAGLSQLDGLPAGVSIVPLAQALTDSHPLVATHLGKVIEAGADDPVLALNAAFMSDGVVIHVERDVVLETPIHLAFAHVGAAAQSVTARVLVVAEAGASFDVVETHQGPDGVVTQDNVVTEFVVGDGAELRHVRFGAEGDRALSLSNVCASLGAGAKLETLNMVTGGAVNRCQVFMRYAGEGAHAGIRGAALLRGEQHADSTLVIDHAVAHGESRELFRHVLDGEATGVFQGRIIVRQHAQKTDGQMASNALLLSDGATMNNKPELEIFADDVVCAHGATCGALDEDLLFYLMARGIPRRQAEALLIESFAGEVIDAVANEAVREALSAEVARWLAERT